MLCSQTVPPDKTQFPMRPVLRHVLLLFIFMNIMWNGRFFSCAFAWNIRGRVCFGEETAATNGSTPLSNVKHQQSHQHIIWSSGAVLINECFLKQRRSQRSSFDPIKYYTLPEIPNEKVTKTQEGREVSPFPGGDHKAVRNRQGSMIKTNVKHK